MSHALPAISSIRNGLTEAGWLPTSSGPNAPFLRPYVRSKFASSGESLSPWGNSRPSAPLAALSHSRSVQSLASGTRPDRSNQVTYASASVGEIPVTGNRNQSCEMRRARSAYWRASPSRARYIFWSVARNWTCQPSRGVCLTSIKPPRTSFRPCGLRFSRSAGGSVSRNAIHSPIVVSYLDIKKAEELTLWIGTVPRKAVRSSSLADPNKERPPGTYTKSFGTEERSGTRMAPSYRSPDDRRIGYVNPT